MSEIETTSTSAPFAEEILLAADAMGSLMEYWGFKHIHGVLWMLLYVTGEPTSQQQLIQWTGYSPGAISMALNELLDWGVVRSERIMGTRGYRYHAEGDVGAMIRNVLARREKPMIEEALKKFQDAAEAAALAKTSLGKEQSQRLATLTGLTGAVLWTMQQFINHGTFPFNKIQKFVRSK